MSLEASRRDAMNLIRDNNAGEASIVESANRWFLEFKQWEAQETFERSFAEDRMTLRMAPYDGEVKKFDINSADHNPRPLTLNPNITALKLSTEPQNFLDKRKNELGLHEYSAVLLNHGHPISKQVFPKPGAFPIFMPIPLEEDMQLFEELSQLAKRHREGALYQVVVNTRAKMTRITYGSPDDMAVSFLRIEKGDNKDHFKYGYGVISGAAVPEEVLRERRANALNYKTRIIKQRANETNNEVTIKYRQHGGGFPWVGNPGPRPAFESYPAVGAHQWVMATFDSKPQGILSDNGEFMPFRRR